ncbi:hypothetical protein [Natrinema altunense]|uniref:Uncharacterized protein n=1 Tax=Natrinema altunense (strain JCM 12890 / CGMCC 1.3731 / AJ2) TaxID=1227494 RepID=L9ZBY8_NATA2|nr:hypothetical protein [Natrinema altunense]ELY83506.1 hypothetical protein C485_17177 [Natrinema altunense JCM 12890]
MYGSVQLAGYLALLATPAALLLGAVRAPTDPPSGLLSVQFGVVLAGTVVAATERRRLREFEAVGFDRTDAVDALAVAAAAVGTYWLSVSVGLGPVLASAAVGLTVGLTIRHVDGAAYCGSFVGMASPALFPSLEWVALAGLLAGLAFVATAESFGGFGGKYGTIALFGCIATATLTDVDYAGGGSLAWRLAPVIVAVAVVAAVATIGLRTHGGLSSVVASAAVGVVAGVAFPPLLPELGATLATVAFCASFVGMSSGERLESTGHVAGAGLLCGVVFLAVSPALAGAGGKLGTTAFVSCLAVAGAQELHAVVRSRGRRFPPNR